MLARIRQFWRAITASPEKVDWQFVDRWLVGKERRLFDDYALYDQLHAINVAKTALVMAGREGLELDRIALLMRAALLHDIGRVAGDLPIWGKVTAVLVHRFCPRLLRCRAADSVRRGRNWRHILYIYWHHPELSAERLKAAGCEETIVAAVAGHHRPPTAADDWLSRILKSADSLN
ncbi:MAG: HD domain-containing protein [Negativicutes bacterium]|nr:HD domain-containing protein [Negativicutes bacterium]